LLQIVAKFWYTRHHI